MQWILYCVERTAFSLPLYLIDNKESNLGNLLFSHM